MLVQLLAERAGHLLDVPKVNQVAVVASLSVCVYIYMCEHMAEGVTCGVVLVHA